MGGITQKELESLETEISQIIDNLDQEKQLKQQLLTENETLKQQLTEFKRYKTKYQQLLLETAHLKLNQPAQSSQTALSEREIAEVLLSAKMTAKQIIQSAKQEAQEIEQIKKSALQAIKTDEQQFQNQIEASKSSEPRIYVKHLEMRFGNERTLDSIKEQMQAVFQEMFSISPDNPQNEVNLTVNKTKSEEIKPETIQKRKATDTSAQTAKVESKNQEGATSLIAKLKKKNDRQHVKAAVRKRKRIRRGVIGLLVVGGLVSMTVTLGQFYAITQVQGHSMKPTLKNKTIMVIQKPPVKLARNDLITFSVPSMGNEHFVKRIVALPGDSIYANGGDLYVNGKRVKKIYSKQTTADFSLFETSGQNTVPAKKIFVLGDNRQHSTDSRSYGFIDDSQVEGKILFK